VVFAIGDRVDETLGLPCSGVEYVKNPNPDPDNPGDESYQVFDPETGKVCPGLFVIGWSRQASDGVVGRAKQDGERGMAVVNRYLEKTASGSAENLNEKIVALREFLQSARRPERRLLRCAQTRSRRKTGIAKPRSRILQIFHR